MEPNTFVIYGVAAIIGIVIQLIVIRTATRADEVVRNQQAMNWFLIKLCEKSGVPSEEIDNIRTLFKIK